MFCLLLPRSNASVTAHIISYIAEVVYELSHSIIPSSFHLGPVSITLCLKLPTVAAVRGRPSLLLSPADCVEWPANSRSIVLMAAVFTYSPSTSIVRSPWLPFWCSGRHGCAARISCCEEVTCSAHSDTLSLKAAASVRHGGVNSARCRSADAGKTIVVLFVVACPHGLCDTVLHGSGLLCC